VVVSDKPYDTVEGLSEQEADFAWQTSTLSFVLNFHTDLLAEGRKQERERIAAWLRKNNAEICDWSPTTIAAAIIDEEHWQ
jgi:hypothetical protein